MKILIAYDSGNGTVKTAVERLSASLSPKFEVVAISLADSTPNPADYDLIVVGASVRFGKLRAAARKYLKQFEEILAQKPLGLFFCCGITEEQEYYAKKLFPAHLQNAAFAVSFFGGSLNLQGLGFFEKLVVRSMRSSLFEKEMDDGNYVPNLPYILPENIDRMAGMIDKLATEIMLAQRA